MIEGELLKDARQFILRITQHEMAELLGVSLRTVGNWERGGVPTSREHVVHRAIEEALIQAEKLHEDWRDQQELLEIREPPAYTDDEMEEHGLYVEDDRDTAIFIDYAQMAERHEKEERLKEFTFSELVTEIQSRYNDAIRARHNQLSPVPDLPDTGDNLDSEPYAALNPGYDPSLEDEPDSP